MRGYHTNLNAHEKAVHAETARATPRSQPCRSTRQRPRIARTDAVAEAEASSACAAAPRHAVFRSTLRGWRARRVFVPDWPVLSAFAESAEGFRALHRIVLAALFVFGVMHGAGAETLRRFLQLAGLAPWFASSPSSLRRAQARMVALVGTWGDAQRKELGAAMFERVLTVLLDETWKPDMILVALDAASGFLLCERHADRRDGATWKATMATALAGLQVQIHHAVADRAQGIARYVHGLLGAHAGADLFHGLHDLGAPVLALHRKRNAALRAVRESVGAARREARALVARLEARIELVTGRLREVSDAFHPFDLVTGGAVSVEALRSRLEQAVARVEYAAIESDLSAKVIARIEKAQRLIPVWCASLTWWLSLVDHHVAARSPSVEVAGLVREVLIPLRYLERAVARAASAEARCAPASVVQGLGERLAASAVWCSLPAAERSEWESTANWLADQFVRASSSVEGRNGLLSLRYHHRRALPPEVLKALTVVHNFVLRRDDGTTAAERFFGVPHGDLFTHLLEVMPPLPRPRRPAP